MYINPQDIGDIDGGWLQDTAESMGLLERVEVQKACSEDGACACAEYGDFPQECLRYTKDIRAAIDAAIDAARSDKGER